MTREAAKGAPAGEDAVGPQQRARSCQQPQHPQQGEGGGSARAESSELPLLSATKLPPRLAAGLSAAYNSSQQAAIAACLEPYAAPHRPFSLVQGWPGLGACCIRLLTTRAHACYSPYRAHQGRQPPRWR
jgi:hypothetical protein